MRSILKEHYQKICRGEKVRENLIELRALLAEEKQKREFAYLLGGSFDPLIALLRSEDPKIRKNAAYVLGEMETEDVLPFLFAAYQQEETMYLRADLVRAMSGLDCSGYLRRLSAARDRLRSEQSAAHPREEEKHIRAEIRALETLLSPYEREKRHRFTGYDLPLTVMLMTGPAGREVTAAQIKQGEVSLLRGAVRVQGGQVRKLLTIRTWSELLFPVSQFEPEEGSQERMTWKDPAALCDRLAALDLKGWLDRLHQGEGRYRYRLEIRGLDDPAGKGKLVHRICDELDYRSGKGLVNDPEQYEVELRLLAVKDGGVVPLLRLGTLPDHRFSYRKEYRPDSITPVNAALMMALARPYLKEGAQVLDPCCGVGTLLVERNYCVQAGDMYGLDKHPEAIEKARANARICGMRIHWVNRDLFTFRHTYLFDEVVSDLPVFAQEEATERFCVAFLEAVGKLLRDGAVLVLYHRAPDLLKRSIGRNPNYRIRKEYLLKERSGAGMLIVSFRAGQDISETAGS